MALSFEPGSTGAIRPTSCSPVARRPGEERRVEAVPDFCLALPDSRGVLADRHVCNATWQPGTAGVRTCGICALSCTMGRFTIGAATPLEQVLWNHLPITSLRWSSSLLR